MDERLYLLGTALWFWNLWQFTYPGTIGIL